MEGEKGAEETMNRGRSFLLLGPPIALLCIAGSLTGPVLMDLIVYQTCAVSLQINSTECLMLRTKAGSPEAMDLEAKVEPYASMIVMIKSLVESLLPAVVCLFLGPWSDRGGRRPLLLAGFSGWTITFVSLSFMCSSNISPWYLLLALVPTNIVGGSSIVRLASVCYISDTTAEKDRTLQLALVDIASWGGVTLGALAAPLIYKNYGYLHNFGTSAACCGIALVYTHFLIPETVKNSSKGSIRGMFKISIVKELVASALMKRESFHRSIIWLSIFTIIFNTVIYQGDTSTIEFLFTRTRLGWDVKKYFYFVVADAVLRIAGLSSVFLRDRISGVTDTFLSIIGLVSGLGSAITRSLTWQSWHMYLAVCIGVFNEITRPAMQSIVSKFVPAQEVGKVFSLATLLEVLGSLATTPLYTLIYSHYLPPIYPSPVYLFSIGFWALSIICVVCIHLLIRKSREPGVLYAATAKEDF